jgi:aryl carrier-like protein
LTIKGPLPATVYSLVIFRNGAPTGDPAITYEVIIMDENGEVLVEIEEFTAQRLVDATLKMHATKPEMKPTKPGIPDLHASADYVARLREEALREGIQPNEGLAAFDRILAMRLPPQIVVSPKDFRAAVARSQAVTPSQILERIKPLARTPRLSRHPRPDLKTPFAPPETAIERSLAELWQELLGVERLGSHDNFFELGGDSVLAIQIIARAHEMDLHFSPQQLFQNPTIAQLAIVAVGQAKTNLLTMVLEQPPVFTSAVRTAGDFPLAGLDAQQFAELSDFINDIDGA